MGMRNHNFIPLSALIRLPSPGIFGILHHVPDWQVAVAEIRRVLRPSGRFFFMEVTCGALTRRSYRHLFANPAENRFSCAEFIAELERQRIAVG